MKKKLLSPEIEKYRIKSMEKLSKGSIVVISSNNEKLKHFNGKKAIVQKNTNSVHFIMIVKVQGTQTTLNVRWCDLLKEETYRKTRNISKFLLSKKIDRNYASANAKKWHHGMIDVLPLFKHGKADC